VNTLLYHGAIALVGLCVALSILGRPARPPRVDQEKPIDDQAELKARRKRFPFYLLDPRRRRPVIRDSQNAMFAKERQTGLLGRGTFAVRVLYGFTLVSFFIAVMTVSTSALGRQSHTAIALSLFLDTLLILVFTPTLVATAMAREWEWQNVDSLRMTLLTPREILWGKLHASIRLVSLPIIGALLGSSVLLFFAYDSPLFWTVTFISSSFLFICVVYTLALSLWCTVGMRRSLTALLVAYGTGIFALGLLPIAGLMALNILVPDIRLHDEHFVTMFLLSPIYAFQAVLENYGRRYAPYTMDNYWAGACCFYLLFSGLLFWHAERRFRRALERDHL
jgi:hypothetical protein